MRKQYTRTEPLAACGHCGAPHPPATNCPPRPAESRRRFLFLGAASAVATAVAGPRSAFGSLPPRRAQTPAPAASGPNGAHAYFRALGDHPRLVAEYSFRNQKQINRITPSGVSPYVTYNPAHDTYHTPHDAAKVVVPSGKVSIRPFPNVPIGIGSGSCLVTWDHVWGREYLGPHEGMKKFNHKQWVLASGDGTERWAEVLTRYTVRRPNGAVCRIDLRAYGRMTDGHRMQGGTVVPREGVFYARPDVWLRYWVLAEDIGTAEPKASLWCADEKRNPKLLYSRLTISNPRVDELVALRCQFNSSQGRSGGPDLVSYMRNVVVLRDVSFDDVKELLVKPTAEG